MVVVVGAVVVAVGVVVGGVVVVEAGGVVVEGVVVGALEVEVLTGATVVVGAEVVVCVGSADSTVSWSNQTYARSNATVLAPAASDKAIGRTVHAPPVVGH